MRGERGDWLIRGVKGELYFCKPDIFALTYERPDGVAQASSEPVAFVPVHPRSGPLWSDTYAAASFSERSPNYPRMALYAAQPPAAPVGVEQCQKCGCDLNGEAAIVTMCHPCADGVDCSSAVTEGAEEAIRDWWYSDRRQPMTSKEAAKSLIWYLAKCGFKIVREPQAGEWINEPLRNWTASTNEPQTLRESFEKVITALQYDGSDTDSLTVGEIRRALP
jgi:hypothetical protein